MVEGALFCSRSGGRVSGGRDSIWSGGRWFGGRGSCGRGSICSGSRVSCGRGIICSGGGGSGCIETGSCVLVQTLLSVHALRHPINNTDTAINSMKLNALLVSLIYSFASRNSRQVILLQVEFKVKK